MKELNITLSPELSLIIECSKDNPNEIVINEKINIIKNWDVFIDISYSSGIFPLVYNVLKKKNEILSKTILQKFKSLNMDIVQQNMIMTTELFKITNLFKDNSIEVIAFKGPTLSELVYSNVISRQYVDIDLLVRDEYFEKAVKILKDLKYKEKLDYSFGKEKIKEVLSDHTFFNEKKGTTLEIHNKLFSLDFPIKLDINDFFINNQNIPIGNNLINTFSNEYLLVYLCLHGSKHLFSRLSWILDIDKIIGKYDLDWELIDRIVNKYNAKTMFYSSLFLSKKLFDTNIPKNITKEYNYKYHYIVKTIIMKNRNIDEDKFSFINLIMFDNIKQKLSYILYIFKPTYLDYQTLKINYNSDILYYILRPFNILFRYLKRK